MNGQHLILDVDRLVKPAVEEEAEGGQPEVAGPSSSAGAKHEKAVPVEEEGDEEEPLIKVAECRICQEEDSIENLETPCACSGSLKV